MGCISETLTEIHGFGGYEHYENTLKNMKINESNGYFVKVLGNAFEITFRCTDCGQVWKLGIPDFPVQGYFLKSMEV